MIPYWSQPALHIGPFTLYAHGILLVLGILVSSTMFVIRARAFSPDKSMALRFILILLPIGFLGSHLMYSFFDAPGSFLELQGISSLGGILICVLGLALCVFRYREIGWRWFDAASYAGVYGALIARFGCFLAHDRIGVRTSSWFSVKCFDGSHYDLALIEMAFLAICLSLLIWLERRGWRLSEGMIFAILAVSYGLLRFMLGELRDSPERYLGLAPEQLGAAVLVMVGACCWLIINGARDKASAPKFAKHRS